MKGDSGSCELSRGEAHASQSIRSMTLPEDFNFIQMIHAANKRVPAKAIEFGTQAIYKGPARIWVKRKP
jgi:hypothetical protein